ncbi:MAG TPA: VWA domain-containing protein [Vicinamibacterales bacterium]|nr:VWA domain-containing protein [Vicinamibacterales bacterium]
MAMRSAGAAVGVLALVAAWSAAARAEPTRPLVTVPLFVTDARGQAIRNLKLPDIEVAENGAPQKIASVVFRGQASRRVAIYLDEYHVSPGASTARARASVGAFVERHLRPDDAVILMKPLDSHAAIAPVSSLEIVRRSVAEFDGRRGVYDKRGPFEAEYMSAAPAYAARQRAQVVRAGMESLAIAMRDGGDAAKALIIVTEGFRSSESSRMRTTTLRTVARAARLANVPVYIVDPSATAESESPLNEAWRAISLQTGGMLVPAGSDIDGALSRVAADLEGHYVVEFQGAAGDDGAFHGIEVTVKRRGAQVRAPSGYWAPFGASRFPKVTPGRAYANLLTPHVSGLIQPWFRMAPAVNGNTRVTFSWMPRPLAKPAERVEFAAVTFEGQTLHTAALGALRAQAGEPVETTFEVPPGPLQISMAIAGAAGRVLDTDVRYIEVPRLDASRPHIAAVEIVRPRSLPEFRVMQSDPAVMPTEVRDFHRRDHLLVRVRAFAAAGSPEVQLTLLNRVGHPLLALTQLEPVDGARQFALPFARYPRGEYRLLVRATSGGETVTQVLTIRLIG